MTQSGTMVLLVVTAILCTVSIWLVRRKRGNQKRSVGERPDKPALKVHAPLTGPFVLPQPEPRERLKIEIHTLRYGDADWIHECAPTLDAWCAHHSLPYHITSTWDPSYPNSKFCVVDMLREFLAGASDWMMYIDADVVVHPQAPIPYFKEPGFYAKADGFNLVPAQLEDWFQWCTEKFGRRPQQGWIYRNTGIWVVDRASAATLLAVIEEPYHDGVIEQHHLNWWLHEASAAGLNVPFLPAEWNRFPSELEPSWMFHIYAKMKLEHLRRFRKAGLLADAIPQAKFPLTEPPDFGKGAVVWKDSGSENLWNSSRSVLRHWSEKDWPLVLFGKQRPDWWTGEFVEAGSHGEALWLGTQCAKQVLWMNPDTILLADQSPVDFATARDWGVKSDADIGKFLAAKDPRRRELGKVLLRLRHEGGPTRNHSTGIPQLYQRDRVRAVFDRFGIADHLPFETAYHNFHRSPSNACTEKASGPGNLKDKLWASATPELKQELKARFGAQA